MAIPSSGLITINDIHKTVGGTSGTTASLNDTDIRSLHGSSSGTVISMNEFYSSYSVVQNWTAVITSGSGTSQTTGSFSIGTAAPDRRLVIFVERAGGNGTMRITGGTIKLSASTSLSTTMVTSSPSNNYQSMAIFVSDNIVATGTTATMDLTFNSSAAGNTFVHAYAIYGYSGTVLQALSNNDSTRPVDFSFNTTIPAESLLLAGVFHEGHTPGSTRVWSQLQLGSLNEDLGVDGGGFNSMRSFASGYTTEEVAPINSSLQFQSNDSNSSSNASCGAAIWIN